MVEYLIRAETLPLQTLLGPISPLKYGPSSIANVECPDLLEWDAGQRLDCEQSLFNSRVQRDLKTWAPGAIPLSSFARSSLAELDLILSLTPVISYFWQSKQRQREFTVCM